MDRLRLVLSFVTGAFSGWWMRRWWMARKVAAILLEAGKGVRRPTGSHYNWTKDKRDED